MKKSKKTIAITALLLIFFGSPSAYSSDQETELESLTKELRMKSRSLYSPDDRQRVSDELKLIIDEIQKFEYLKDYRASRAMIKVLANPDYKYNDEDKAKHILEDAFAIDNHRKAHMFAKLLKNKNLLFYDQEDYLELMHECSEYGNKSCDLAISEEKEGVKVNSEVANEREKSHVDERIKKIKNTNPLEVSVGDANYYMSAYSQGYHSDKDGVEELLYYAAISLDESAINTLYQIYLQKIVFDVTEEKMFKIKYIKAIAAGTSSPEYRIMEKRARELGKIGGVWKMEVEKLISKKKTYR